MDNFLYNCGGCGVACPQRVNATAVCNNGNCQFGTCNTGFANCNGSLIDGCETNINNDANNCGTGGNICAGGQTCQNDSCIIV